MKLVTSAAHWHNSKFAVTVCVAFMTTVVDKSLGLVTFGLQPVNRKPTFGVALSCTTEFNGTSCVPGAGVVVPAPGGFTSTVNCAAVVPPPGSSMPARIRHGIWSFPKPSTHSSKAPMSNPPIAGRSWRRWSTGSDDPGSAAFHAGLVDPIAMVGVAPWLYCSGPSCGSLLDTTPPPQPTNVFPSNSVPSALLMMRLPANETPMLKPVIAHSRMLLPATIVL